MFVCLGHFEQLFLMYNFVFILKPQKRILRRFSFVRDTSFRYGFHECIAFPARNMRVLTIHPRHPDADFAHATYFYRVLRVFATSTASKVRICAEIRTKPQIFCLIHI